MQILSNGYKLPDTGDFGSTWFVALEDNITRVNSHSHNGTDSSQLSSVNIANLVQTVLVGTFSADGDTFSSTVVFPGVVSVDTKEVIVRDPTTKDRLFFEISRISANQVKIYTDYPQTVEVMVV